MRDSIRIKIISFQIAMIILIIVMIFTVMDRVLMGNIGKIEENDTKKSIYVLEDLIQSDSEKLDSNVYDYGVWDDTFSFVQNRNPDYLETNFYADIFLILDFNMMAIVDRNGELIYGKSLDLSDGEERPFPQELLVILNKASIPENSDPEKRTSGLVMLPEGPALISVCPILTSKQTGPVNAHLVFGRYLDEAWVKRLSERSQLKLNMVRLDQPGGETAVYQSITDKSPIRIIKVDQNTIRASIVMEDLFGQAALGITAESERGIYATGVKGITMMLFLLSLIALIFLLTGVRFLDRNYLSRLHKISKAVGDIGENKQFDMRLEIEKNNDELTVVTNKINYMLDELENSQLELKAVRDNMERLVEARTNDLLAVNQELIEEKEKIKHLAYHDFLTGLPNGLMMNNYISHAIEVAKRTEKAPVIMFLDLDGFKMINDTLGHKLGDSLLKAVAGRLSAKMRKSDTVARIGGDEFCILVENIDNSEALEIIAEKILRCFDEPFLLDNQECFLSVSIGIAIYPEDGDIAEHLIKNADLAMYRAKETGKNRYCYCTTEMKAKVIENMQLSNQLWRALERNELKVYYQPQVDIQTSRIVGMEALLRWNHPVMGMIPPDKFISLAEQTGSINPIGEWLLRKACGESKSWQDRYDPSLRIAVNLSVKQFQSRNIVQQVERVLKDTGIDPKRLELEITESLAAKEAGSLVQILSDLKGMGIQIAIDDFGTDYSSMNYLKQLPVDRIKIAMPFVQGICTNEKDEAIIKAVIILAKSMGLGVIAEGVETKDQLEFLKERSCDEIQGYYFYKPMPAAEIEAILEKHREDLVINRKY